MSAAAFVAAPAVALAAGAALVLVGAGALDRLFAPAPRPPAEELLALLAATPVADRRGAVTEVQQARLDALADAPRAELDAELASASGVYRVDLWRLLARRAGADGRWADAGGHLARAVEEMPTDPGVRAERAVACWRAGDRPGFVAATRAWAELAGLPRDEAARVEGWLGAL